MRAGLAALAQRGLRLSSFILTGGFGLRWPNCRNPTCWRYGSCIIPTHGTVLPNCGLNSIAGWRLP